MLRLQLCLVYLKLFSRSVDPLHPSKGLTALPCQSSWLRDALSELDPSCDKLTFVGNPPIIQEQDPREFTGRQRTQRIPVAKPMLRIQATGTFGSTEVLLIISDILALELM